MNLLGKRNWNYGCQARITTEHNLGTKEANLLGWSKKNCYGIAQQKKLTGYSRLVDMIIRFNITRNQVLLQENLN